MIVANGLAEYCIVQSFDHETLKWFENINHTYTASNNGTKINTLYLDTFNYDEKPVDADIMCQNGMGSHMMMNWVTEELYNKMISNGKIIAIWTDATCPDEDLREGS